MMELIQQTGKSDAVAERGEDSSAVSLRKWEGVECGGIGLRGAAQQTSTEHLP